MINMGLVEVARGKHPASRVITGGQIVNVVTGEIYPGGIAILNDRIAAVGDVGSAIGPETEVVDVHGSYLTPGLIDGHVHVESSLLSIEHFSGCALRSGTTSFVTDLHEVAAVGGLPMVRTLLDRMRDLPINLFYAIPSHVPFTPGFETTGGLVGPEEIADAIHWPESVGLSEVVASSALDGDARLLKSMEIVRQAGGLLHGHSPFISSGDLAGFASMGVRTCHECFNAEDAVARLRNGVHVLIREGSVAHSLPEIIRCCTEQGMPSRWLSLITDDLLAHDLVYVGYMDQVVRQALKAGVEPMTAIRMATINAAEAYRIDHIVGMLAPGRKADILVVDDLNEFRPRMVFARGKQVAVDGEIGIDIARSPFVSENSIHIAGEITADMIRSRLSVGNRSPVTAHVLDTPQDIPVATLALEPVPVHGGYACPDPSNDLSILCVVERHHASGDLSLAFVRGYRLKQGAMASSIAHDHHNLIGVGASIEDLALAFNRVAELKGGQVVAAGGQVLAELPLPILGLMSDRDPVDVCTGIEGLEQAARQIGNQMNWPLMFLSFMSCSAGPGFSITDKGIYDGFNRRLVGTFA